MSSSNLREGGYAIEPSEYANPHASAAGAAQQDVFLLQRDHAAGLFLLVLRRICQKRPDQSEVLSRSGAGLERDGQLLGIERDASDVSRARDSAAVSRNAGDGVRHAWL